MFSNHALRLIQKKAEVIDMLTECLPFTYLENDNQKDAFKYDDEKEYFKILTKMIAVERDHLNAIILLYDSFVKDKPETRITQQMKTAIDKYNDDKKIIK